MFLHTLLHYCISDCSTTMRSNPVGWSVKRIGSTVRRRPPIGITKRNELVFLSVPHGMAMSKPKWHKALAIFLYLFFIFCIQHIDSNTKYRHTAAELHIQMWTKSMVMFIMMYHNYVLNRKHLILSISIGTKSCKKKYYWIISNQRVNSLSISELSFSWTQSERRRTISMTIGSGP